ncbi:MAG TPA: MBL fold metallo-hydrolase, partial [Candidatus Wallbacteria bacterium]|nr:MBL fold metallo-hydrolase [Candidatus Wallbacteria bacterium]
GSSFLKFKINEDGKQFTVVFSGDIGNAPVPILQDPEQIGEADYLIMESTYGDRVRENDANRSLALARVVNETVAAGGKIIIPSFAVGRTQELIYEMHQLRAKNLVPEIPIFVDSPLACSATEIFRKHIECFDKEMMEYLKSSDDPFNFPNLSYSSTPEESRAINADDTPQVIISSSGMANNGRILHHLKYNIFKKESTILFVGYQAAGTLGRLISEGQKIVNIMGDKYSVNARVEALHSYSAHADQSGLIKWSLTSSRKLRNVFLIHGEDDSKKVLQSKLSEVGLASIVPDVFDEFEITSPDVFKQIADGKSQKPVSEETCAAVSTPKYEFMEKPLKKIEGVKAVPDRLDQDLDRMSKKELIKILKEFRSQVQSMESRIDNIIARMRK